MTGFLRVERVQAQASPGDRHDPALPGADGLGCRAAPPVPRSPSPVSPTATARSCCSSPTCCSTPSTRRAPTSDLVHGGSAAGDLRLEGGEALGERGLADRPELGLELEVDGLVVGGDRRRHGGRWSPWPRGELAGRRRGPSRRARRRVASSASSSTQRHTRPARSASAPSSTSPNSTRGGGGLRAGDAAAASRCGRRRGGCRAAGTGCRTGPDAPARRTSQHERQVHAGADGGAVDRGDGGQRRAADAEEALVDRCAGPVSLATRRGGERSAPAQNAGGAPVTTTRADVVVGLELVEGRDDLVDHVEVERVAPVGVVEGDDGDAVGRSICTCVIRLRPRCRRPAIGGRRASSRTTAGEWRKKLLDVLLVAVLGSSGADGAPQAQRLDEGLAPRRPTCSGSWNPACLSRRLSMPRP